MNEKPLPLSLYEPDVIHRTREPLYRPAQKAVGRCIRRIFASCLLVTTVLSGASAQVTQLEFGQNSYPSAPNGPSVAPVSGNFLNNTTGTTFTTFTPTVTVTATLSDQVYTLIPSSVISTRSGVSFGTTLNATAKTATAQPVWNQLGSISSPTSAQFTSNPQGSPGTGIDVAANYGFNIFTTSEPLQTANASSAITTRHPYATITLQFNRPVSNPVLHVVGLGAFSQTSTTGRLGFASELDLQTPGVTLTKLSGSSELIIVNNTSIQNGATTKDAVTGAGAASGSIRVNANNITTLTFRIFLRGDGKGTTWSPDGEFAGDRWLLGFSMNVPLISGNVFNDGNGLVDNIVNGNGTNAGGTLYANLLNSGGTSVIASTAVAADGAYFFQDVSGTYPVTYQMQLSTTRGVVGSAPPATTLPTGWYNTGEIIGTGTGSQTPIDGILPNVTLASNTTILNNVNFGIQQIPLVQPKTDVVKTNPGGAVRVSVTPTLLEGSDPEDGTYAAGLNGKKVTLYQGVNGDLYYNNTLVGASLTIASV